MKDEDRNGQIPVSDFIREEGSPDDGVITEREAEDILQGCPPEGDEWDEVEDWIRIAVANDWVDIISTPPGSDFRERDNVRFNVEQLGRSAANWMMEIAENIENGFWNMEVSFQRAWAVLHFGRGAWDYLREKAGESERVAGMEATPSTFGKPANQGV